MADMVRLGAIAVVAVLCAVVVKKNAQEIGIALVLVAGVLILSQVIGQLEGVRGLMDTLADAGGISDAVLAPVFKTVGIAIITKLTAELCRDAKESGIAAFVETAGAITALWVAIPLLRTVLSMIMGLL